MYYPKFPIPRCSSICTLEYRKRAAVVVYVLVGASGSFKAESKPSKALEGMRQRIEKAVVKVAKTSSGGLLQLPLLELSLLPLLSLASAFHRTASFLHRTLYRYRLLTPIRLPVPVVSVGNITWGGNGKTPMVELLANCFLQANICPIILTRGYAGGDEARLLRSHLDGLGAVVGVGPDRAMIGKAILQKRGFLRKSERDELAKLVNLQNQQHFPESPQQRDSRVGIVILDDGMQHRRLKRDLEIVMVNLITRWGNEMMVPRGPLREPLVEMRRADVVVLHHADLVPQEAINNAKTSLQNVMKPGAAVVMSRMAPKYFFKPQGANLKEWYPTDSSQSYHCHIPLSTIREAVVLCVSGVGCPHSVFLVLEQMGTHHVESMDYVDHHIFRNEDMKDISVKVSELRRRFPDHKNFLVLTEKDYLRDSSIWRQMCEVNSTLELLVLQSSLDVLSEGIDLKAFEAALSDAASTCI